MPSLTVLFLAVYVLNILPAFAPPTWIAMSWLGLNYPQSLAWQIVVVGAVAATTGRVSLALLARGTVWKRFLDADAHRNVDVIKTRLEQQRTLSTGLFLTYACSPLPSNFLFLAYGMSTAPLWVLAVPFFLGRLVSYSLWVFLGKQAALHVAGNGHFTEYLGGYFVVTQVLVLLSLYAFVKLDWAALLVERKLRWRKKSASVSGRGGSG